MSKDVAGKWIRVSTGEQDEANQEPDIDRWIEGHGYAPGPTYRLRGKSASKGKHQAELDRVIADMRAGQLTVLVVWHFDRIERRGAWNAFDLARQVKEAGGRIEYVLTPHLNEIHDFSDTFLAMESDRAKAESKRTSERVRAAHERIQGNGGVIGRPGYGFRLEGSRYAKRLVVFEPEARVISEAATRYLDGETIDQIVADFNARGIPKGTKRDGTPIRWHAKTLAGLLRSTSIAGRRSNGNGKTVLRHEAIIAWDTHQRLVARLDSRAHRKGISPGNVTLLTSILFDAAGHNMYCINRTRKDASYYCRKCHTGVTVTKADGWIHGLVGISDEPYLIPQLVPGENHADEIERLRQDRAELDDLAPDYDDRHAALTTQIRALAAEDQEHPHPDRVEMVNSGKTLAEHWATLSTAEQRDLLIDHGVKVTFDGEESPTFMDLPGFIDLGTLTQAWLPWLD